MNKEEDLRTILWVAIHLSGEAIEGFVYEYQFDLLRQKFVEGKTNEVYGLPIRPNASRQSEARTVLILIPRISALEFKKVVL